MAGFTTTIVHSDRRNPIEHGSLHKPLHATVAYGYDDARDLAAVFQGASQAIPTAGRAIRPSRRSKPRSTQMEDGVATVCFATGMARDRHDVARAAARRRSRRLEPFLFGNTNSLFATLASRTASTSTFVDATDRRRGRARPFGRTTRLVFVETIANPRTQVADLGRIGELCDRSATSSTSSTTR